MTTLQSFFRIGGRFLSEVGLGVCFLRSGQGTLIHYDFSYRHVPCDEPLANIIGNSFIFMYTNGTSSIRPIVLANTH